MACPSGELVARVSPSSPPSQLRLHRVLNLGLARSLDLTVLPVPRSERATNRVGRVAGTRRNGTHCVLLLDGKPWRQRPEPHTGATKRLPPLDERRMGRNLAEDLLCSPGNAALSAFQQPFPTIESHAANERVRIIRRIESLRRNDVDRGADRGTRRMLDCLCRGQSASVVVVEAQHDGFDTTVAESLEEPRAGRGDAECGKLVMVEESFDEDELWGVARQSVGWEAAAAGTAEV